MLTLYSLILSTALALSLPWWLFRMFTQQKYRAGLRQRLGSVPASLLQIVGGKRVVWLHAVSVGETIAATGLVSELERAIPNCIVVVSTTTQTGQQVAATKFGADRVFYFPLDFAFAVRAYLKALRPELMILMESELWPRHLSECVAAGVPVVVANTRVSDRTFARTMKLRALWRRSGRQVRLFLAQSEEDARRLLALGAPADRVVVTGNLKYDVRSAGQTLLTEVIRQHLPSDARVLVAGSTLEGEERALLDCLPQLSNVVLLLAPRHPERFDVVANLLVQKKIAFVRLSEWRRSPAPLSSTTVLLLDSIGELASLYSLADLAFIGGSLGNAGGHNPLEPAQWGVPVVQGPSYQNFRGPVEALLEADAISIVQPENLCAELAHLFLEDTKPMGLRAQQVFQSQTGATQRTIEAIKPMLEKRYV